MVLFVLGKLPRLSANGNASELPLSTAPLLQYQRWYLQSALGLSLPVPHFSCMNGAIWLSFHASSKPIFLIYMRRSGVMG